MLSLDLPFETPLPLPIEFDGIASIDCRLICMCLMLVNVEWKVEHEGMEKCKDWNNRKKI
jgi:hypothetical protein